MDLNLNLVGNIHTGPASRAQAPRLDQNAGVDILASAVFRHLKVN